MKEHEDDVLPTVKESTENVDSTTADDNVTDRRKIEGLFGEEDEGEDMMVDVVGADVVVDDHGGKRVELDINGVVEEGSEREIEARDQDVEKVGVVEESRFVSSEKVEVVVSDEGVKTSIEVSKEVIREHVVATAVSALDSDAQKSEDGDVVGDSKMDFEPSSAEAEAGGGEIAVRDNNEVRERYLIKKIVEQPTESVQEVADGDHVMDETTGKEADVLNSSKVLESCTATVNPGSQDGNLGDIDEGLVVKDEAKDDANNQISSTEVNAGTHEDNVHLSTKNLDQQAGVDQTRKEILQPTVEVATNDVQDSGNGTRVGDSDMDLESLSEKAQLVGGEIGIREGEASRGLAEETVDQAMESVQEVADVDRVSNEKTGDNEVLDSTKIPESATKVHGLDVEEGLAGKDEAQGDVSKNPSSECTDNPSVEEGLTEKTVDQATESVQEVADVDSLFNEKSEKDEVLDSTKIPEPATKVDGVVVEEEGLAAKDEAQDGVSRECTDDRKKGLTEGTVEVATESVQEVADVDNLSNEKTDKDEVLDSTKIPELVSKVDEEVIGEGLAGKDEAKDVIFKDPSSECHDTPSLSNDAVNAGTGEGAVHENALTSDQKAEVDQMSKEDTSHSTTEVKIDNAQESEKGNEVGDSKMDDQSMSQDPQFIEGKEDDPERGSTKVVVEDHVASEKTEKEVEVLDSSKIPEASTMNNLNSKEVDMVVVHEGLDGKENLHTTIEVMTVDASHHTSSKTSGLDIDDKVSDSGKNMDAIDIDKRVPPANEITAVHIVVPDSEEVNHATSHADYGEDAGMDIDEVLGWKDEIPGIEPLEKDQDFKINPNPEADFKHSLQESSYEPVLIGQQAAELKNNVNEDFCRDQETEEHERNSEAEHSTCTTDDVSEPPDNETSISLQQSSYFHPPVNPGEFSPSDLVWGKVRSHPWWPGQIFHSSDASDKAIKYHKKNCFLVAYFGDRTFAWNDSSVLKPFRAKFSQIHNHSNSEAFHNAVHCALEEVSRRVELGLSCSCIPKPIYQKIECQIVENAGIKKESSRRHGIDKSASVNSFEPDKLIDYVRLLAKFPHGKDYKMDLTMAKAQLSSYVRFKGYRELPEIQFCGNLLEDASVVNEGVDHVIKNEIKLPDLKLDFVSDSSRKRKASDSVSVSASVSDVLTPTAKPSFKVGELIQRVATQLTGPPSETTLPEMLSQLHLTAQDPMKGYPFLNTIIPFFYSHRAAVFTKSLRQNSLRKRKANENDPEDFEFDDVNDSYWTDRIIQNNPEEQQQQEQQQQQQQEEGQVQRGQDQVHGNQNGTAEHQIVAYEQDNNINNNNMIVTKPVKQSRRSNKKRFFSSNHEIEAKEQSELMERRRLNMATEVLMKFSEGIYFPSEIHLNKMFRRFGPLMESETEVDRQSGRARVVFKRCSDAEVAHSSAGKFNIFGEIGVHYELNYTPLISYKPLPLPFAQEPADAC